MLLGTELKYCPTREPVSQNSPTVSNNRYCPTTLASTNSIHKLTQLLLQQSCSGPADRAKPAARYYSHRGLYRLIMLQASASADPHPTFYNNSSYRRVNTQQGRNQASFSGVFASRREGNWHGTSPADQEVLSSPSQISAAAYVRKIGGH